MRIFFIAIFAIILPISSAHSFECGLFNSNWKTCNTDNDCVLTKDSCGVNISVSKEYKVKADAFYKCVAPVSKCLSDSKQNKNTKIKSSCRSKKCIIK